MSILTGIDHAASAKRDAYLGTYAPETCGTCYRSVAYYYGLGWRCDRCDRCGACGTLRGDQHDDGCERDPEIPLSTDQVDALRAELQTMSATEAAMMDATFEALGELSKSLQAIAAYLRGEVAA